MRKLIALLALSVAAVLGAGCAFTKSASQAVPLATRAEGTSSVVLTDGLSEFACTRIGSLRARLLQEHRVMAQGCWKYMSNTQELELTFDGETQIYSLSDFVVRDSRAVRHAQIEADIEARDLAGTGWKRAGSTVDMGIQGYAEGRARQPVYQVQTLESAALKKEQQRRNADRTTVCQSNGNQITCRDL